MRGRSPKRPAVTTPDLVILSLLAERPMHGYQVNFELERRCVRDWAAISRPQIYYSLEKLSKAGLIRAGDSEDPAAGPDRRVFETTAKGSHALSDSLERRLDDTARPTAIPDVGCPFVAGAPRRFQKTARAPRGIS